MTAATRTFQVAAYDAHDRMLWLAGRDLNGVQWLTFAYDDVASVMDFVRNIPGSASAYDCDNNTWKRRAIAYVKVWQVFGTLVHPDAERYERGWNK